MNVLLAYKFDKSKDLSMLMFCLVSRNVDRDIRPYKYTGIHA